MARFNIPRGRDLLSSMPVVLVLAVGAVLLAVSAARVVLRERAVAHERAGNEARVRELEAEIWKLRRDLGASGLPETVERLAKEQLGLKRSGEEVVVVVPERLGSLAPPGHGWRFLPHWLKNLFDFLWR